MIQEVFFEETGEVRVVTHQCRRCVERSWFPWTMNEARIVGPRGVAHAQHELHPERTVCGKDATGDRWWWSSV